MKLSVIMPMYNTEEYVEEAINSMMMDFPSDSEVIVVNDSSTDSSLNRVKKLQKKYKEIKIINNKKNLGNAQSINVGLNIATGKYICILDSDDFVERGYHKKLLCVALENDADVVSANIALFTEEKQIIKQEINMNNIFSNKKIDKISKVNPLFLLGHWTASSSSIKMIRRSLLVSYSYEGMIGNDIPAIYPVVANAKKIYYIPKLYLYYRVRENSLSHLNDFQSYDSVINLMIIAFDRMKQNKNYEAMEILFYNNYLTYLFDVLLNVSDDKNKKELIQNYYNKTKQFEPNLFLEMKNSVYYKTTHINIKLLNMYFKGKIVEMIEKNIDKPFNPKVSVVIPVYNGSNYLREAIDSVIAQTYKNIEIIVVNDGSTDNGKTKKIAKSYGNKIKYFEKENGGVSTALNMGIEKMTGEYFSWLSHDDMYLPNKIEEQIKFLNTQKDKNIILYSDLYAIDKNGKIIKEIIKNHKVLEKKPLYSVLKWNINGITLLIPKNIFKKYGLFDPKYRTTQDYHYWSNIMYKEKFVHMNQILAKYRYHKNQDTQSNPVVKKESFDLWKKIINNIPENVMIEYEDSVLRFYICLYKQMSKTVYDDITNFCKKLVKKELEKVKVSVIIPFNNDELLAIKSIQSVEKQSHNNIEIILSSFDSNFKIDRLKKYVDKNKYIKLINNRNNCNIEKAKNNAIKKATGDYIAFLSSGDEFKKEKIEIQLIEMIYTKHKFSHTSYINFENSKINSGIIGGKNITKKLIVTCPIKDSTVMINSSVFLDNQFLLFEDIGIGSNICNYIYFSTKMPILGINQHLSTTQKQYLENDEEKIVEINNIIGYILKNKELSKYYYQIGLLYKNYIKEINKIKKWKNIYIPDNTNKVVKLKKTMKQKIKKVCNVSIKNNKKQ